MSFIQRELDRIAAALRENPSNEAYGNLYYAQQALAWAMEPDGFASPFNAIAKTATQPLTDIQADSGDCSVHRHPPQS